ncbi:MAG: EAL domain-containing protein [Hyphomicrobiaceae bacterium]|nr:MAG: EAL domain-containing protein [Hyphomicrobiaceae bacterium]
MLHSRKGLGSVGSRLVFRRRPGGPSLTVKTPTSGAAPAYEPQELKAQNLKLDAALSNMLQGLAMFDADERIVIANDRFAEMYGLTPAQVQPGTSLSEIIELRIKRGLYVGTTVDEVVNRMRERVARGTGSHMTARLADGRTILVSIQPRPDGGWVTTHQDISDRECLYARFEQQNALLKQREDELRRQNALFDTAVNNMSQGLCLFDADQRVVIANRRYAEIYGLTAADVKPGTTLKKILQARAETGIYSHVDADAFVHEAVQGFRQRVSQVLHLADGRRIAVVRLPMPDGGLISTHEDITDREALTARLARQNEQLDLALRNMAQGLAMFDAEQRLIVCNKRYADIYGLSLEQVQPGVTLRQIVEYRIAKGLYAGASPEEYVKERVAAFQQSSQSIHRLSDGRAISICRQPMKDGGWVTTHEDITERERLNVLLDQQHKQLKEQEERLRAQNLQLDAALNNMVQGLAMFDSELRIVVANARYADMYGLTMEQVRPGMTLRQILERCVANGLYADENIDRYLRTAVKRMTNKKSSHHVSELADGRCIAVSVQPLADGGTVTTHQDITEQRRSEAKIVYMALHDTLTGLPNRVLLNDQLEHALIRAKRGEIVATHMLDLDHFKQVNDTLGHPAGDKLLKMVAARLRKLVRESDTVARMGGDEFAIVQVAISDAADATTLAHRIIENLSEPYEIDGQQVVIGTSVGIAVGPNDGLRTDDLLRNADLALYRAKSDGRATLRFFEPEMDAQMQQRRAMECDLRNALPARAFELYYQPVVNLKTGEISGFEALVRWHHPTRGIVAPGDFIPLAEEIGLIVPLGEWILREACATAAKWPDHLHVAVNLSPVQFRNPGLLQVIVGALAASGLAPDRLELEITETILLHDSDATLAILYQLRELGVRIAMDDFGTGYSSLSYLQSFPFDKIKIDRSFVKDIAECTSSLNIVRAVAALATGLGMQATAEGVETREQLDTITSEGCTEMQGFLFSEPLPAVEIERLFLPKRPPKRLRQVS